MLKVVSSILPSETIQLNMRRQFPNVQFLFHKGIGNAMQDLQDAEVFITYGEDLTEKEVKLAKNLKWIMVMSAGLEKMPIQIISERNIVVTNARGIHKIPMAEYTMGMLLQYEKNLFDLFMLQENKVWNRHLKMGELHDKTILVIGAGAIGSEIARLSKAFGMRTIGINQKGQPVEHFDKMETIQTLLSTLKAADYVVSVLPSTEKTKYLFQLEHFQAMKPSAVYINIGRGDFVKDEIIIEALEKKYVSHVILDVFETEPLPIDHPFWELENLTLTPHLSSHSKNYLPRSFEIFAGNLQAYLDGTGQYINNIDINRGY